MKKILFLIMVVACMFSFSKIADAYSVSLVDFDGRPAEALLEITGDGTDEITFELSLVNTIGDFRGVFFDFSGNLSNFTITGGDVTGWTTAGNVSDLGRGANMTGTGLFFDAGVEIGTPGAGRDDIDSTSFTLFNDNPLNIGDLFGARLTSVGVDREDSRKLIVPPSAPEPSTVFLFTMGLLGFISRKFRIN